MSYNLTTTQTISEAIRICRRYHAQGMKLSLRQLFYQFVSEDLEENTPQTYKRIGSILTKAREDGDFPLFYLEDRGRSTGFGDWSDYLVDVDDALATCAEYVENFPEWTIKKSLWWEQPELVSVWVEKEALSGVFERPCRRWGVPLFACKGYASMQSLYDWHLKMVNAREKAAEAHVEAPGAVILYFGDHDPEGFDIPRAAEATLMRIQELTGDHFPVTFKRIGLTMEQIQEHNPPPSYAKKGSSRYDKYVEEQNTIEAWELDALDPATLRGLIEDNIKAAFDFEIHEENNREVAALREELVERLPEVLD